jgi:hypothetical protein
MKKSSSSKAKVVRMEQLVDRNEGFENFYRAGFGKNENVGFLKGRF